jgi:hypothetical protein
MGNICLGELPIEYGDKIMLDIDETQFNLHKKYLSNQQEITKNVEDYSWCSIPFTNFIDFNKNCYF